jgi:hypothetical protein
MTLRLIVLLTALPMIVMCRGATNDEAMADLPERARFTSSLRSEEISYCLVKDWGGRLSFLPGPREGTLWNPVYHVLLQIQEEGPVRTVSVRARNKLTASQMAAVDDCTTDLDRAFRATPQP